jgi:alcohol dehydrogenase class IV
MNQVLIGDSAFCVGDIIKELKIKKYLLVCGKSIGLLPIGDYLDNICVPYVKFSDFTPNPLYEDVFKGVDLFNGEKCDGIIAIGGGSAIDVAKCIKLFSPMNKEINYLKQGYKDSGTPLIAIPTTAGTGSKSTRFAVIYYKGEKQSVTHNVDY